jgi:hypothetical protein
MKRILMAAGLVILLCAATATTGRDFNDAALPQLQIGRTTLAEATSLLGAPPAVTESAPSGAVVHVWTFASGKASFWSGRVSSTSKSVTLVFNADGTLQRIGKLQGIQLSAADLDRLMTKPAQRGARAQD